MGTYVCEDPYEWLDYHFKCSKHSGHDGQHGTFLMATDGTRVRSELVWPT